MDIPKACDNPSQSKLLSSYIQIMILYRWNTLAIKTLSFEEDLLFQSYTKRSTITLRSIKCFLNGRFSFIFTILLVHITNPTISSKNLFVYFSQLSPPYSTLIFHKIIHTFSTKTPFFPFSLIYSFFFKLWIVITELTITDSSSRWLRKLVIAGSSLWWRCLQLEW